MTAYLHDDGIFSWPLLQLIAIVHSWIMFSNFRRICGSSVWWHKFHPLGTLLRSLTAHLSRDSFPHSMGLARVSKAGILWFIFLRLTHISHTSWCCLCGEILWLGLWQNFCSQTSTWRQHSSLCRLKLSQFNHGIFEPVIEKYNPWTAQTRLHSLYIGWIISTLFCWFQCLYFPPQQTKHRFE